MHAHRSTHQWPRLRVLDDRTSAQRWTAAQPRPRPCNPSFFLSGAVALTLAAEHVTLLQVLKAYLERKSSISFQVTRPDGQKVTVNASTFGAAQLEQTRKLLTDLLRT